jgi:hypothetical protein
MVILSFFYSEEVSVDGETLVPSANNPQGHDGSKSTQDF